VDFVEDRLPATEHAEVQAHLPECARCASQATWIGYVIELVRTDDSQDAPSHVLNRAYRLLRTHRLTSSDSRARRRVVATLRLDSAWQPFAAGLRAGRSNARQFLYDIGDDKDLEVRVEPSNAGWTVAGQILGACTPGEVVVEGAADHVAAELNDICEFSLPPLPAGVYSLILRLEDVEVEVPRLELRD
jgi:hypothetical protein